MNYIDRYCSKTYRSLFNIPVFIWYTSNLTNSAFSSPICCVSLWLHLLQMILSWVQFRWRLAKRSPEAPWFLYWGPLSRRWEGHSTQVSFQSLPFVWDFHLDLTCKTPSLSPDVHEKVGEKKKSYFFTLELQTPFLRHRGRGQGAHQPLSPSPLVR